MARRSRHYRHFRDTRRARLLREHASRTQSSPEGADNVPTMEQLCEGGGNVFAEVGLPHPEQELLKALLTIQLCRIIKERNVTQVQAAEIRGIMNGALREIAVRPAGNSRGEM